MISHAEAEALISARLDGPLDAVAERALINHLTTCASCRYFAEQSNQLAQGLRDIPYLPASPAVSRAVLAHINRPRSPLAWLKGAAGNIQLMPAFSALATVLIVVVLGAFIFNRIDRTGTPLDTEEHLVQPAVTQVLEIEAGSANPTSTAQLFEAAGSDVTPTPEGESATNDSGSTNSALANPTNEDATSTSESDDLTATGENPAGSNESALSGEAVATETPPTVDADATETAPVGEGDAPEATSTSEPESGNIPATDEPTVTESGEVQGFAPTSDPAEDATSASETTLQDAGEDDQPVSTGEPTNEVEPTSTLTIIPGGTLSETADPTATVEEKGRPGSADFRSLGLPDETPELTETPEPTATDIPPTETPEPTATDIPPTETPEPTSTDVPPTETPEPTATDIPSTETPEPTATDIPPTETPEPTVTDIPSTETPEPTVTDIPPTETPEPTATDIPPTETPEPTATDIPPTETPEPTATDIPPTETPEPTATDIPAIVPIDGTFASIDEDTPGDSQDQQPTETTVIDDTGPTASEGSGESDDSGQDNGGVIEPSGGSDGGDATEGTVEGAENTGIAGNSGENETPETVETPDGSNETQIIEPSDTGSGGDEETPPNGIGSAGERAPEGAGGDSDIQPTLGGDNQRGNAGRGGAAGSLESVAQQSEYGTFSGQTQGMSLFIDQNGELILSQVPDFVWLQRDDGYSLGSAYSDSGMQGVQVCDPNNQCLVYSYVADGEQDVDRDAAGISDVPVAWLSSNAVLFMHITADGVTYVAATLAPETGTFENARVLLSGDPGLEVTENGAFYGNNGVLVPARESWLYLSPDGGSRVLGGNVFQSISLVRVHDALGLITYVGDGNLVVASLDDPGNVHGSLSFNGVDYDLAPNGEMFVVSTGSSIQIVDFSGAVRAEYPTDGQLTPGGVLWADSGVLFVDVNTGEVWQVPNSALP